MRWYDLKTGKRFDASNPTWKKHMKNKDGTVKARADWKLIKQLEEQGLIMLVPSTTEVAKVADGFGVFGAAAGWGMRIGVDAAVDQFFATGAADWQPFVGPFRNNEADNTGNWIGAAIARADEVMAKPRERGSELHEVFHLMRQNLIAKPTTEQLKCYATMNGYVEAERLREYKTEVEFVNAGMAYGGTCDFDSTEAGSNKKRGIDWKTVQKKRPPRKAEILQAGAYANNFGWDRCDIVYIDQTTLAVCHVEVLDKARLLAAYDAFVKALTLFTALEVLMPGEG